MHYRGEWMYRCKICQEATYPIRDKKRDLCYHKCHRCGFIYLDDSAIIDPEHERRHYEKHNNGFESLGYVKMFEQFIEEAITPYCVNITTALDFGCGRGPVLAELLRREGMEVDLYDLYFYPQKVYEDKKYDLIVSTEVFEHLQDPMDILALLSSHTTKEGYIVLMTKFPPDEEDQFLDWWYRRDVTHISFFTPKSFGIMAEKRGLKVLKILNDNIVIFQKT